MAPSATADVSRFPKDDVEPAKSTRAASDRASYVVRERMQLPLFDDWRSAREREDAAWAAELQRCQQHARPHVRYVWDGLFDR